jgi:hypothetical protein
MKIRSKLKRAGGTKIELGGKEYHFKPEDKALKPEDPAFMEADHVCEIEDADTVHRLVVGIREGYEPVDPDAEIPQPTKKAAQTITGTSSQKKEPGAPIIIKNGDDEEINLSALEPDALRALAKGTFGINVHYKWTDETVIAKIVEATRAGD